MPSGTIRFKGAELLERYDMSVYRLTQLGAASYPTLHKYFLRPDHSDLVSRRVIYGILVDGFGLSLEEAQNVRMGDLWEFLPDEEPSTE